MPGKACLRAVRGPTWSLLRPCWSPLWGLSAGSSGYRWPRWRPLGPAGAISEASGAVASRPRMKRRERNTPSGRRGAQGRPRRRPLAHVVDPGSLGTQSARPTKLISAYSLWASGLPGSVAVQFVGAQCLPVWRATLALRSLREPRRSECVTHGAPSPRNPGGLRASPQATAGSASNLLRERTPAEVWKERMTTYHGRPPPHTSRRREAFAHAGLACVFGTRLPSGRCLGGRAPSSGTRSWASLGPSWDSLGPSWGSLGPFWRSLGALRGRAGSLWGRRGPPWAVLGPS